METSASWSASIKRERLRHGWTQKEVARRISSDNKTIGRWERGETFPDLHNRRQLMELYQKSAEDLGFLDQEPADSTFNVSPTTTHEPLPQQQQRLSEDWGSITLQPSFYGYAAERALVTQWIDEQKCRLVTILGIGGMGKTTLATRIAQDTAPQFDYVFCRSLQQAPPLSQIVDEFLQFTGMPRKHKQKNSDEQLDLLLTTLKKYRCLLFLDNVESILQPHQRVGLYHEHYEEYGAFFKRIGETDHQSCLLLTSREKPGEIAYLEGKYTSPVRSLHLTGINAPDIQQILSDKALSGSQENWDTFVRLYAGNPLALQLVSEPIQTLFGGEIAASLQSKNIVFGEVVDLLHQQFQRLSPAEQHVLYWLAIERETVPPSTIQNDIAPLMNTQDSVGVLSSLQRRSIIQAYDHHYLGLQPVIMEYVTAQFVAQLHHEISTGRIHLFGTHMLQQTHVKDYLRENQLRFIIAPLLDKLRATYDDDTITHKLDAILAILHTEHHPRLRYAANNVLTLLVHLQRDLHGYDFSHLTMQHAYLQNVHLAGTNFAHTDLAHSLFSETFTTPQCIAASPDGTSLAIGTTTGEVFLRQADSLIVLHILVGHEDGVRSVAFNNDGSLLASSSEDQTIRIWQTATGRCLHVLKGHQDYIKTVAFHHTTLASGSDDQTVRLWDTTSGQCLHVLHEHTDAVRTVAFNHEGTILASGGADMTIRLWNTHTSKCTSVLRGHTAAVRTLAFNPTNNILASGSEDASVRLWDIEQAQCNTVLTGHKERVRSIQFSPDGVTLASASDDNSIRLWDSNNGRCTRSWYAHTNRIWSIDFLCTTHTLVSASEDDTLRYWDISSGQCLKTLQGRTSLVKAVAVRADDRLIASGNEDHHIHLWERTTGRYVQTLTGHANRVRAIAFSPDGVRLASGSEDETVRIWDSNTGKCLAILREHTHLVRAVAFNTDGSILASASHDQTIRLWDVHTGRCLNVIKHPGGFLWSLAFHGENLLASTSDDHAIHLWDSQTGQHLRMLRGHDARVWSIACDYASTMLVSGSDDRTLRIWDVQSGQCVRTLKGHTLWVRTVAISPDGTTIASGSHDRTIRLWDARNGQCLQILRGHTNSVWSVAFSNDGTLLISGGDDGTTRIWDIRQATCIRILREQRPYEGMNIFAIRGLTEAQKTTLLDLGAIEA